MEKLHNTVLKILAKTAVLNAKKEANAACICIGYQPKMPKKVKEMQKNKVQ